MASAGTDVDAACLFCALDAGSPVTTDFRVYLGDQLEDNAQIVELDSHWVLVDIAPIATGHLLVVPKAHVFATAEEPPISFEFTHELADRLGRVVSTSVGARGFVVFEHGSRGSTDSVIRAKCAPTEHAHLHVVPILSELELEECLHEHSIACGGEVVELNDLALVTAELNEVGEYHYVRFSTASDAGFLYRPGLDEPRSQLFRRLLVDADVGSLGTDRADMRDWRDAVIFGSDAHVDRLLASMTVLGHAIEIVRTAILAEQHGVDLRGEERVDRLRN